jgi:hypothetical protein
MVVGASADGRVDRRRVGVGEDPHVDTRLTARGDHIGSNAPLDRADVHGDAPIRVIEGEQTLDHRGELQDGGGACFRVEAGMGCSSLDRHRVATETLASRLEIATGPESGFENEGATSQAAEPADRRS